MRARSISLKQERSTFGVRADYATARKATKQIRVQTRAVSETGVAQLQRVEEHTSRSTNQSEAG